jgi:hypothetical protein
MLSAGRSSASAAGRRYSGTCRYGLARVLRRGQSIRVFGARERFAIQVEVLERTDTSVFGTIWLWIDGVRLGDPEQVVVLNVPADFLGRFLETSGQRRDVELAAETPERVLDVVTGSLFEGPERTLREIREAERRYGKLVLCPGGGESFDGELAVVLEDGAGTRVVFRDYETATTREIRLGPEELESIIRAFLDWFDASAS